MPLQQLADSLTTLQQPDRLAGSRLAEVTSNPLNLLFLAALLGVTVWALWPRDESPRQRRGRARSAPGVLISIGILGTFTGILVGLLGFDAGDLPNAVPKLLGGMTTAFVSSVAGLGLALLVRGVGTARARGESESAAGTTTVADLYTVMTRVDSRLEDGFTHLRAEIGQLRDAIGGQGDSTLVGQIKLLRQDQADSTKRMIEVLEEFAEKVSELGSKALIEALREVIQDFNRNLTEQFGENFKHLNLAVEKLVDWQENYRQYVSDMQERLDRATKSIELVQQAVADIAESVTPLPNVNEKLLGVLEQLALETIELDARLKKFAEMGEQAVQAIPVVEANIERLTQGFSETIAHGLNSIQTAQREHQQSANQLQEAFTELRQHATAVVASSSQQHQALNKSFSESLASLENTLREMHSQSAKKWQETLREQVDRQQDAVRQQLDNLNQTLESQLSEALNRLSQHLLGLHGKLVDDYAPLLDSLRRVVELGRRGMQQ